MELDPNTCAIIIAGQGGGYGECIIAHIGNNDWIVVDSCIDPFSRVPITLSLLKEYKVDPKDIKLILCTHWHQDHINGLSKILEVCSNANFTFARATDLRKFLRFIEFDYQHKARYDNSVTKEFRECLRVLKRSNQKERIIRCSADQILYSNNYNGNIIRVSSLSPSSKALTDFELELTEMFNEKSQSNIRIPRKSPNDKSVVLLLEIGEHSVLLGADLEVTDNDDYGWLNITRHSKIIPGANKSSLFKIPHHGSGNGYHNEIWDVLLKTNPEGTITPFSSHNLPSDEQVELYDKLTNTLSLTSSLTKPNKPKKRERSVKKMAKDFIPSLREVKPNYGVVSCFIDIAKEDSQWSIIYKGEAIKYSSVGQ